MLWKINIIYLIMVLFKKLLLLFLFLYAYTAFAQTGTYRIQMKNGASGTIAIIKKGNYINADVFAWWHTPSGRHGVFTGNGLLKNKQCILTGTGDGSDCHITLTFNTGSLKATFDDCMTYNLPEDFSGNYNKITDATPGNYIVAPDKVNFYKKTDTKSLLKTYLIKGNKVTIDLENIQDKNWVLVNYINASHKTTSGFIPWSALKRL